MYERRQQRLLSRIEFSKRVGRHGLVALGVLVFELGGGVLGYHYIAGLSWIDSLLNASMILGGMGPVDPLKSEGAKIFASCYALFSGLAFTHRKEYATWIAEAKRDETRQRRVVKAIEMLTAGTKTPR